MEVCNSFLFQLLTSLENTCSQRNFPAGIYRFCMFVLIAHFTVWRLHEFPHASDFPQRFSYIVLRTFIYHVIFWLNLVYLELRDGFYYFTLITNLCFLSLTTHSTLLHFFVLHGVVLYCYYIAYDPKACSIFNHI